MKKNQHGGIMIEALVALVIFALGIVGLLGSFAVSTQLSGENRYRTEAVAIADELFGQMAVSNSNTLGTEFSSSSSRFQSWLTDRAKTLPNGNATINFHNASMSDGTLVQLEITWLAPNSRAGTPPSAYTTTTYFRQPPL